MYISYHSIYMYEEIERQASDGEYPDSLLHDVEHSRELRENHGLLRGVCRPLLAQPLSSDSGVWVGFQAETVPRGTLSVRVEGYASHAGRASRFSKSENTVFCVASAARSSRNFCGLDFGYTCRSAATLGGFPSGAASSAGAA